jgi:polysaccharide pyruvyl transferase WcaK-like protein
MNIAVFGWYHHRNAGDDRIQYSVTRWLDGHTLAFLPAGRPPSIPFLRTYDAVIIGGGGVLMTAGGVLRNLAGWTKAVGIPVALVGVSVENLPDTLRTELRAFLDCCCFAWFRDRGSIDELGEHPNAFVAPDLTWLYPWPTLAESNRHDLALCLRHHAALDIAGWQRVTTALDRQVVPWPLYLEGGGDADALRRMLAATRVPDEFSTEPLRNASAAISMRYHGVLFALQSGRPAIGVGSQPKLVRFMTENGLADWRIADAQIEALPDMLKRLDAQRPRLLDQARELGRMLHASVVHTADSARDRLLSAAARPAGRRSGFARKIRALIDAVEWS